MNKTVKDVRDSAIKFAGENRLGGAVQAGAASSGDAFAASVISEASPGAPAESKTDEKKDNKLRSFLDTIDPSQTFSGVLSADYSAEDCPPAEVASALRVMAIVLALRSKENPSALTSQVQDENLTTEEEATISRIANCSSDVVRHVLDWIKTPELVRADKVKMVSAARPDAGNSDETERFAESIVPWQKKAVKAGEKEKEQSTTRAGRPSSFVRAGVGAVARRFRGSNGSTAEPNGVDPQDSHAGDLGFARPDDDLDDL